MDTIASKISLVYLCLSKKNYLWALSTIHILHVNALSFLPLIFNPLILFNHLVSCIVYIKACANTQCQQHMIQSLLAYNLMTITLGLVAPPKFFLVHFVLPCQCSFYRQVLQLLFRLFNCWFLLLSIFRIVKFWIF